MKKLIILVLGINLIFMVKTGAQERGLVAYWNFDEEKGDTVPDLSGNKNDGIIKGEPGRVKGIKGKTLELDGDDYIDCGNNESLNNFGTGGITVESWVYVTKDPSVSYSYPSIVEKSFGDFTDAPIKQKGFNLIVTTTGGYGKVIWWAIGDGTGYNSTSYSPSQLTERWIHIVGTADSASESSPRLKLYLDGALAASVPRIYLGPIDVGSKNLYLGVWKSMERYFSGIIDEVKIYNRALKEEEIKAGYEEKTKDYVKTITSPQKEIPLPEIIVIPTPKELKSTGEEILLTSSGKILFDVLLSDSPAETEKIAAQELAGEIFKISGINQGIKFLSEKEPSDKQIFLPSERTSLYLKNIM
ncbi:MAG: LamG domain-containing protein [Candidatus Omnitrophota bacterium]